MERFGKQPGEIFNKKKEEFYRKFDHTKEKHAADQQLEELSSQFGEIFDFFYTLDEFFMSKFEENENYEITNEDVESFEYEGKQLRMLNNEEMIYYYFENDDKSHFGKSVYLTEGKIQFTLFDESSSKICLEINQLDNTQTYFYKKKDGKIDENRFRIVIKDDNLYRYGIWSSPKNTIKQRIHDMEFQAEKSKIDFEKDYKEQLEKYDNYNVVYDYGEDDNGNEIVKEIQGYITTEGDSVHCLIKKDSFHTLASLRSFNPDLLNFETYDPSTPFILGASGNEEEGFLRTFSTPHSYQNGKGEMWIDDFKGKGKVYYKGGILNGQFEGYGTLYFEDGSSLSGNWKNDELIPDENEGQGGGSDGPGFKNSGNLDMFHGGQAALVGFDIRLRILAMTMLKQRSPGLSLRRFGGMRQCFKLMRKLFR